MLPTLPRTRAWMALAVLLLYPLTASAEGLAIYGTWELAGEEQPLPGAEDVMATRWTAVRPPAGAYDRIGLNRYRGPGTATAALLYLPGTNMNGQVAITDEDHNLWLFLARRGVTVFTLDYRTHALPATDLADPAVLRDWTAEAFAADVAAAAREARRLSGQERIFVGGFSRGVAFAYAQAAAHPQEVAGIVALDGFFKSSQPAGGFDRQAALKAMAAAGRWAQDVGGSRGWQRRQEVMTAAAADPAAPAIGEQFASVGEQVAQMLYRTWGGGGKLANAVDGYSSPQLLARLLAGYDRYYPAVQDVDGAALASQEDDPASPLDDGWATLHTPVIYIGSTNIGASFLLDGIASAVHCAGNNAAIHVLEGHGHLDILIGKNARQLVYEPILAWLRANAPSAP